MKKLSTELKVFIVIVAIVILVAGPAMYTRYYKKKISELILNKMFSSEMEELTEEGFIGFDTKADTLRTLVHDLLTSKMKAFDEMNVFNARKTYKQFLALPESEWEKMKPKA